MKEKHTAEFNLQTHTANKGVHDFYNIICLLYPSKWGVGCRIGAGVFFNNVGNPGSSYYIT